MRGFTINADYVHVDGFEITNLRSHFPDSTGVFTNGAQDEISGCYIHHSVNDAGVVISGRSAPRNNLVKNNMISRKPQYDRMSIDLSSYSRWRRQRFARGK